MSRRQFLVGGGAAAAAAAAGVMLSTGRSRQGVLAWPTASPVPEFRSRPDLRIPGLTVAKTEAGASGGRIFMAPYNAPSGAQAGAVLTDSAGNIIWEQPLAGLVTTNFRVQTYRGAPALTWWEGVIRLGHGVGSYVIADASYRTLARPQAGNGLQGDLHEFRLTERGTALLTSYVVTRADLRAVGGPSDGTIQDAIFQEVELASGRVLLEWHSLDHIALSESYWPVGADWDYVHLNSVAVDSDGNLLVSSRNTHTVYKVDRRTGEIMWRLGGKHGDFAVPRNASFAWQHDAVRQPNGALTVFDNGTSLSRALVLSIDERSRKIALEHAYTHPAQLFADSQGSVQVLPNGNVFVGWGAQPYISEFTPDGTLVFDARLGSGDISYRAFRYPWTAAGIGPPALATRRTAHGATAYVSWNGDTRVTHWTALAGKRTNDLAPIATATRTGFETAIALPSGITHLQVRGSDATGKPLTSSAPSIV